MAGKRIAIAMSRIYAYLEAARLQVSMIRNCQKKANPKNQSYSENLIQAFIHTHLYFTCWTAIGRMIHVIKRGSRLESPNTVYKQYRITFEAYARARDHFEDYEERLPGGGKSRELPDPVDFGNLQGGSFSIGGFHWDVSRNSLKKLETLVADLCARICEEALQKTKNHLPEI